MRRLGRYALRLLAVAAIVAVLVGLGYLWRGSALASVVTDGGGRGGERFRREGAVPDDRGGGTAFGLSNIDDIVGTIMIGVGVLGVVILIDKARRRRRPIQAALRNAVAGFVEGPASTAAGPDSR